MRPGPSPRDPVIPSPHLPATRFPKTIAIMGSYYDDEAPRRHKHRSSRRPVYEEEEVIESRSSRPQRQMDLVRRPRDDSSSSVEEVRRDFAPGDGANVYRRTTVRDKYAAPRARSVENDRYDDRYDSRRSEGGRRSGRREEKGMALIKPLAVGSNTY